MNTCFVMQLGLINGFVGHVLIVEITIMELGVGIGQTKTQNLTLILTRVVTIIMTGQNDDPSFKKCEKI